MTKEEKMLFGPTQVVSKENTNKPKNGKGQKKEQQ